MFSYGIPFCEDKDSARQAKNKIKLVYFFFRAEAYLKPKVKVSEKRVENKTKTIHFSSRAKGFSNSFGKRRDKGLGSRVNFREGKKIFSFFIRRDSFSKKINSFSKIFCGKKALRFGQYILSLHETFQL